MVILFSGHRNRKASNSDLCKIIDCYPGAVWLHGGAIGFDSQVELFARENGVQTQVIRPDYDRFGKSAPLRRNDQMIELCDLVIALYDGRKSGGTYYTIKKARETGKRVIVIQPAH